MPHMCPTRGCKKTVPDHILMCPTHWRELPRKDQDFVYRSLRENGPGLRHIQTIQPVIERQAIRMNRGE